MPRKNRTPEENAHREKIGELLQLENIGSMDLRKVGFFELPSGGTV